MLYERLFLRPSVAISEEADGLLIRYAHWELSVPASAVGASQMLRALATDRTVLQPADSVARGVLSLLAAQGCFVPTIGEQLQLADVLRLFQPIRSEMYATYYAHPLWAALREGSASIGQVAAWALHNYHISRSAGVIAARMASQPLGPFLRQSFRDDALEEFWHCDSFYFVHSGRLRIDSMSAKAYVPLPAVRAFEDVALHAADTDWLAHLLIAYFQESSIAFGQESERFYDAVEDRYGLPGFFKGWRQHLALDRDQDHAGGLASLVDGSRVVSRCMVEQSVEIVQLAHHYLLTALDQLMASPTEAHAAILQRQPSTIAAAGPNAERVLPNCWWPYLRSKLEEAAFAALAHVRDHDGIMAAGNLAAAMRGTNGDEAELGPLHNPWLAATGNFLVEQGRDLPTLLALTHDLAAGGFAGALASHSRVKLAAERARSLSLHQPHIAVARFQLREFLDLAYDAAAIRPVVIGQRATA
jgi:hypothetical protein